MRKPSQTFFSSTKCLVLHISDLELCDLPVIYDPLYRKRALSTSSGLCRALGTHRTAFSHGRWLVGPTRRVKDRRSKGKSSTSL